MAPIARRRLKSRRRAGTFYPPRLAVCRRVPPGAPFSTLIAGNKYALLYFLQSFVKGGAAITAFAPG